MHISNSAAQETGLVCMEASLVPALFDSEATLSKGHTNPDK